MSYVNPGSCIAVSIAFVILGAIAVTARYYVRLIMKKGALGIDDWLCIPALILTIGCAVDIIIGVRRHAVGYHTEQSNDAVVENAESKVMVALFQMLYFFLILQTVALGCIKLSIIIFYRRVFIGKVFRLVSWTMIIIIICWTTAFFLACLLACGVHPTNFWGPATVISQKCVAKRTLGVGFAMSDAITDVIIISIPPFCLWQLQMRIHQKISLIMVFMIGILAVATSIWRCIVFAKAVYRPYLAPGTIFGLRGEDLIGVISVGVFWAMIELGVALVVCCLPSLRPLMFTNLVESIYRGDTTISSAQPFPATIKDTISPIGEVGTEFNLIRSDHSRSISTERTSMSAADKEDRKYGYVFSVIDDDVVSIKSGRGGIVNSRHNDRFIQEAHFHERFS